MLALRGLSRVIKFCTRFLLREKWFAAVWAEALLASHLAMVSAVDELEVAVAAVDVIFSMIKTVIHLDSEPAVAPGTGAGSGSSLGKKKAPSSASLSLSSSSSGRPASKAAAAAASASSADPHPHPQLLSKEDFEQLQACKEILWRRTWTAVHHAAAFPCPW